MRLITPSGVIAARIDNPDERSIVGRHANAVGRFLATGETDGLVPFRGVKIAGHQLQTEPDALEAWAAQGELEFEEIYDATGR